MTVVFYKLILEKIYTDYFGHFTSVTKMSFGKNSWIICVS